MFSVTLLEPTVLLFFGYVVLRGFFTLNSNNRYKNKRCISWLIVAILLILSSFILFVICFIK